MPANLPNGPLNNWRARQDSIQLLLRGAFFKLRLKAHHSVLVYEILAFPSVVSRICYGSRLSVPPFHNRPTGRW
jgi:hypothetical protein